MEIVAFVFSVAALWVAIAISMLVIRELRKGDRDRRQRAIFAAVVAVLVSAAPLVPEFAKPRMNLVEMCVIFAINFGLAAMLVYVLMLIVARLTGLFRRKPR